MAASFHHVQQPYSDRPLCQVLDVMQGSILGVRGIKTCADVLKASPLELMNASGRSYDGVHDLVVRVSRCIAPKAKTAYNLYQSNREAGSSNFVSTLLHKLDSILQGGLPCGTITEVAGPPGCGKTQFCMTVCSAVIVQECSAVYIDTEAAFTATRFLEIARHRWNGTNIIEMLDNKFYIFPELTCSDLHKRLSTLEDFIVEHNVKLIVIDSIASLIRKEFESSSPTSITQRATILSSIANMLKQLAQVYKLAVLVVNQITTKVVAQSLDFDKDEDDQMGSMSNLEQEFGVVTVALGDTWSHIVNSRLVMDYLTSTLRKLSIVKSPLAPPASLACRIQSKGIVVDWHATGELEVRGDCFDGSGLTVHSDVMDQLPLFSELQ